MHLYKQIKQTAMKTSTKIKIGIITTLIILTNVSFGQNNNESKEKETKKTETEQNDVVRSKRGPQPTMTVTTESRTYLV